jgi:hypothetical protein
MIYPFAYVGPGAGFAFLGSFLTILIAFLLSVVSILIWPFRAAWRAVSLLLLRRRKPKIRKLIFLGFDGLDPRLTEQFMAEGKLPNFARLAAQGSFHRLRTTFPALSPVAWSTFATGVNPARHNIFDFLNRDLRSYLPELSSSRVIGPRRFWKLGRYRITLDRPTAELHGAARAHHIPPGEVQWQAALRHVHAGSEGHAGQLFPLHHAPAKPDLHGRRFVSART